MQRTAGAVRRSRNAAPDARRRVPDRLTARLPRRHCRRATWSRSRRRHHGSRSDRGGGAVACRRRRRERDQRHQRRTALRRPANITPSVAEECYGSLDLGHLETLIPVDERHAPIVTVQDGASHSLAFLGRLGAPVVPLGVDEFGQSGSRDALYHATGIDADQIVKRQCWRWSSQGLNHSRTRWGSDGDANRSPAPPPAGRSGRQRAVPVH